MGKEPQIAAVIQSLSRARLSVTPWTAAHQASLSFTVSQSLLRLMSIESIMPFQPSHPVAHFSSSPQSFPASGSFPMSWLFASGDQNIGASASASVPAMNIQDWFPLGMTGLISLLFKGLSGIFSSNMLRKHQFFGLFIYCLLNLLK